MLVKILDQGWRALTIYSPHGAAGAREGILDLAVEALLRMLARSRSVTLLVVERSSIGLVLVLGRARRGLTS